MCRRRRDQIQHRDLPHATSRPGRTYARRSDRRSARGPSSVRAQRAACNDWLGPRTRLREHVHGENTNRTRRDIPPCSEQIMSCPRHGAAPPECLRAPFVLANLKARTGLSPARPCSFVAVRAPSVRGHRRPAGAERGGRWRPPCVARQWPLSCRAPV